MGIEVVSVGNSARINWFRVRCVGSDWEERKLGDGLTAGFRSPSFRFGKMSGVSVYL
jgi:hypothetical protein